MGNNCGTSKDTTVVLNSITGGGKRLSQYLTAGQHTCGGAGVLTLPTGINLLPVSLAEVNLVILVKVDSSLAFLFVKWVSDYGANHLA